MWRLEPIPRAVRTSPVTGLDRLFVRTLGTTLAAGAIVLAVLYLVPVPEPRVATFEELPERLARLIVEPKAAPEPPPVVETQQAASTEEAPEKPEREPAPKPKRVTEVARRAPAAPPKTGGERGAKRGREVMQAVQAGGMLQSIDSMLGGVRALDASTTKSGAGGTSRAKQALKRAAERQAALAEASQGESGAGGVDEQAGAAGSQTGDGAPLASAQVNVEDLATVGGSGAGGAGGVDNARTAEALMAVVQRYAGGVKYCYDLKLREHPELRGRLVALITVAPSGVVSGVKVVGDTLKDADLRECVLGQVRAWKFRRASGGPVSFRCPFVFTPPNGS